MCDLSNHILLCLLSNLRSANSCHSSWSHRDEEHIFEWPRPDFRYNIEEDIVNM